MPDQSLYKSLLSDIKYNPPAYEFENLDVYGNPLPTNQRIFTGNNPVVDIKSDTNEEDAKKLQDSIAYKIQMQKANYWGYGMDNPYLGGDLRSRAYDLGYYAKQGNALGIVTSGLGLGLGVGKSLFNGMGDANQLNIASQNYNTKTRNAMVRPSEGIADLYRNAYLKDSGYAYGGMYAEGGGFDPASLAIANDRALSDGLAPNSEIEDGEFVNQGGTIKEAIGERHEDGGVKVNLNPGDRVLTDRTELGSAKAKMLEKEYKIKVKPKHTYSEAMDKLNAKIGYTKVVEEQEKLMEKLAENQKVQDKSTRDLNENFIAKKMYDLEGKRKELEETQNFLYNVLYGLQEVDKKKNDKGNFQKVDVTNREVLFGADPTENGENMMAMGGRISADKAKKILHEGTIGGKKITDKQRRLFGAMSNMADGGQFNMDEMSVPEINAMYGIVKNNPNAFANTFEQDYNNQQNQMMFAGGGMYDNYFAVGGPKNAKEFEEMRQASIRLANSKNNQGSNGFWMPNYNTWNQFSSINSESNKNIVSKSNTKRNLDQENRFNKFYANLSDNQKKTIEDTQILDDSFIVTYKNGNKQRYYNNNRWAQLNEKNQLTHKGDYTLDEGVVSAKGQGMYNDYIASIDGKVIPETYIAQEKSTGSAPKVRPSGKNTSEKDNIRDYQNFLNILGGTDYENSYLKTDGKIGPRTQSVASKLGISYKDFKDMSDADKDTYVQNMRKSENKKQAVRDDVYQERLTQLDKLKKEVNELESSSNYTPVYRYYTDGRPVASYTNEQEYVDMNSDEMRYNRDNANEELDRYIPLPEDLNAAATKQDYINQGYSENVYKTQEPKKRKKIFGLFAEGGDMPMQEQEMVAGSPEITQEQAQQVLESYIQQLDPQAQQDFLEKFRRANPEQQMNFVMQLLQQMQ